MAEEYGFGLAGSVPRWVAMLEQSTDPEQVARFEEAGEAGAPDFAVEQARHTRRQNEAELKRKRAVEDAWFGPKAQGAAASALPAPDAVEARATEGGTSSPDRASEVKQADGSVEPKVGAPSEAAKVASPPMGRRVWRPSPAAVAAQEFTAQVEKLKEARQRAKAEAEKMDVVAHGFGRQLVADLDKARKQVGAERASAEQVKKISPVLQPSVGVSGATQSDGAAEVVVQGEGALARGGSTGTDPGIEWETCCDFEFGREVLDYGMAAGPRYEGRRRD
jgi:hypothetical protein